PVHWSANFDEIQDFENDIVNSFGGSGLAQDGSLPNAPLGATNAGRSRELDALAAYVTSLSEAPLSPARAADGSLSVAAVRGKALFARADVGCTSCHAPPRFTDSRLSKPFVLHDVGTLTTASGSRLGSALVGLDTPSLIGVWDSAPYLHDGSAATLRDVVTTKNLGDNHGRTSILSAAEVDDLVEYLRSIDGRPDSPQAESTGSPSRACGTGSMVGALLAACLGFFTLVVRSKPIQE
ncbi:MAG: hypothetical protein H0V44_03710, partial [Planctomycetes bacterium]|nr:hypothetical protein [Planctomycetota bacterium]